MAGHPLFIYGTLHPDRAPAEIAPAVAHLTPLGPATLLGCLEHTPDYPAARIGPGLNDPIPGHLFRLPDDPALLAALDAYEDFRPTDPQQSLFLRQLQPVKLPTGEQTLAWVYLYNR